jgi:hypothetical protein
MVMEVTADFGTYSEGFNYWTTGKKPINRNSNFVWETDQKRNDDISVNVNLFKEYLKITEIDAIAMVKC